MGQAKQEHVAPTEGQKTGRGKRKKTPVPHHHLRLPPRAPSPLHRCSTPRKRTLLFISSSLARARAATVDQEERGASGEAPSPFLPRGG